ncbi:phage tail protein [Variovorax sp. J22P168]|uniref:phage tail protein n=1 Tax=Variovorax jilinensis TaxID=3053513 RepID=UPI002574A8A1|nr:phage tail protein [Variovorax sp. J22P168]MDM0011735.1 phage tail protein [Variovorax sp. J22P168]
MSLLFETAAPPLAADLRRADVACFVGHVARRSAVPLPDAVRAQLREGGWIDGIRARPSAEVESLLNLPVVIDSWARFDALFAWEARPLRADPADTDTGIAVCATYLGAAVRSFFARGGRRAVVVRVGDPWPYIETLADPAAARRERLRRMVPDFADRSNAARLFVPTEPSTWQGIHHLYGLRDVSLVLLPDLADACCVTEAAPRTELPPPAVPTGFVECSANDAPPDDSTLRRVPAPRLDSDGYLAWQLALVAVRAFLARHQREVMLLAALPLPQPDTQRVSGDGQVHAQAAMLAYLQRIGIVPPSPIPSDQDAGAASAFVQLAWPWLRTHAAADLPEWLESPDGVLAGLVAAGATARGSFRSVAGDFSVPRLRDVADAEPRPSWGLGDDSPDAQLARHVCLFAQQPDGWALQSDVTLSSHEGWRFGGSSRLMGTLLRSARAAGDSLVFDLNGPATWAGLRRAIERLLTGFWNEGAFAGATLADAFAVRCDRSTMTQADLDAGRLVVEITVRPAASIERITVVLDLNNASGAQALREAA